MYFQQETIKLRAIMLINKRSNKLVTNDNKIPWKYRSNELKGSDLSGWKLHRNTANGFGYENLFARIC